MSQGSGGIQCLLALKYSNYNLSYLSLGPHTVPFNKIQSLKITILLAIVFNTAASHNEAK